MLIFLFIFINFSLYIYGNYEINKNKKLLENNRQSIFVKIISPNFDLNMVLMKRN